MTSKDEIITQKEHELRFWIDELTWLERQSTATPEKNKAELGNQVAQLRQLQHRAEEIFGDMVDATGDELQSLTGEFDTVWSSFRSTLKFFKTELAGLDNTESSDTRADDGSELDATEERLTPLTCPKCAGSMERFNYGGIFIDRCVGCRGLWFDLMEHEYLKAMDGSEAIDDGDADVGREFNKMSRIDCPICRTRMIAMVDREQPHIWYEGCIVCHGVFFDAGEFKDYKERSLVDLFRSLLTQERR